MKRTSERESLKFESRNFFQKYANIVQVERRPSGSFILSKSPHWSELSDRIDNYICNALLKYEGLGYNRF